MELQVDFERRVKLDFGSWWQGKVIFGRDKNLNKITEERKFKICFGIRIQYRIQFSECLILIRMVGGLVRL